MEQEEVFEKPEGEDDIGCASNPFLSADLEHQLLQEKYENERIRKREERLQNEYEELFHASEDQRRIIDELQVRRHASLHASIAH
jgi:hypothetical protein